YAIRAFEVHAVDYLLKPFSAERFAQALERAERRLGAARTVTAPELAHAARGPGGHLERLVIRDGDEIVIIPIDTVDYVQGQDDYVEVFHGGRSSLTQQTLQSLEGSLDPKHFVRVHRSYVLNVRRVPRPALCVPQRRRSRALGAVGSRQQDGRAPRRTHRPREPLRRSAAQSRARGL